MEVREFDWDSSRKGASQLSRTKTIRLSTPKTTTGEILIFALTSPLIDVSQDKGTPLHHAVIGNKTDCVLHLLQAGANPDLGDEAGYGTDISIYSANAFPEN